MSLGTKFCSFQMTLFWLFLWLLVIWVSSLFFSSSSSFSQLLCVGVDNALIKGGDYERKVDMCPCGLDL